MWVGLDVRGQAVAVSLGSRKAKKTRTWRRPSGSVAGRFLGQQIRTPTSRAALAKAQARLRAAPDCVAQIADLLRAESERGGFGRQKPVAHHQAAAVEKLLRLGQRGMLEQLPTMDV